MKFEILFVLSKTLLGKEYRARIINLYGCCDSSIDRGQEYQAAEG